MITKVFNLAQSFFIDPQVVKGAKTVGISSVDLFFKSKPASSGNKSGMDSPGVSLFICPVNAEKIPDVISYVNGFKTPIARAEYVDIATSSDASIPTNFKFEIPVTVETGKEFAFVAIYDGNESFDVWTSKQGDLLLGTNKPSPGPSGKYVGNYYGVFYLNPTTTSINDTSTVITDGILSKWKPLSDTDMKFNVNAARYAFNGVLVDNYTANLAVNVAISGIKSTAATGVANAAPLNSTSTTIKYSIAPSPHEYVLFDKKNSKIANIAAGELVYQNTVFYPGGFSTGLAVKATQGSYVLTANTQLPNGAAFDWNNIYGNGTDDQYIVVVSLNDPTSGKRKTNIRKVLNVDSDVNITVDRPLTFSNTSAYFMKSPVARVKMIDKTRTFNHYGTTLASRKSKVNMDMVVLKQSNANSSIRFANDTILSIAANATGTGYSNSDYVVITGFENSADVKGGYKAVANIVTATGGAVTAVYLTNAGAGFIDLSNLTIVVANSTAVSLTSNTSSGSGLTFVNTISTGAVLRAENDGGDGTGGYFTSSKIINMEFSDMILSTNYDTVAGSLATSYYKNPYYVTNSPSGTTTHLGYSYKVASDVDANKRIIRELVNTRLPYSTIPIMASRSNEFVITGTDGNVKDPSVLLPGTGLAEILTTSNNDFSPVRPNNLSFIFGKYAINGDYTGENTDYGNAVAKHITSKINFASDRFAEDLVVYLTAYRPLNTDIKVYARMHNSNDTESFDDKDWTLLTMLSSDAINNYSSTSNPYNYNEMTFGVPAYPNTYMTLTGTANVDSTSTTIVGDSTTFNTDLKQNDLIKLYSPLFPNNYVISVVNSVSGTNQITVNKLIVDTSVVGPGLKIDLIGRINDSSNNVGYPLQAFKNRQNKGVVRYYNSAMSEYDTYNTIQVKLVMLSDIAQVSSATANVIPTTIPRIDDIRIVGVSV
jgi:hypothetical protein